MTTTAVQSLDSRLKEMVGNTYMINTVCFKVLNYSFLDEKVIIGTDKRILSYDLHNMAKVLENFLPAEPEEHPVGPPQKFELQSLSGGADIKNIIMENINRIKADKDYIPQAAAVNENVKTLLDFAKAEIQMYDLMHKMNNHR